MIDGISVGDISVSTLLGIAVLLVLTGRLVPRSLYQDVRSERDEWKQVAEKQIEINREWLIVGQVNNQLLAALPHPEDGHNGPKEESG